MSFLAFLVLGLIAGAIAKLILPGKQGGGWFITLLLGVVGALLGGWLGSLILGRPLTEFWDLGTWLLAIGGSIIVLLIWGLITRNRTFSTSGVSSFAFIQPLTGWTRILAWQAADQSMICASHSGCVTDRRGDR